MYIYGRVDRPLPVVSDLVNLGLYALQSFQHRESLMLSHAVSVQICFKPVNGLDIKNSIRQPIPVINGSYTEALAPDHLLGMGLEYLVSMTSSGVGGGLFEELVWVNVLNSCHDLE